MKWVSFSLAIVAGIAAALAVLPYSWAGPVASALIAGLGAVHGVEFSMRIRSGISQKLP